MIIMYATPRNSITGSTGSGVAGSGRTAKRASGAGRGHADERVLTLPLEQGPLAPATARHAAQPVLESWGLDGDQVYDLLLVISELVT
ncbi:hypothetical protein GTY86_25225, partial [Streptomyces sp. SID5770]|nr:hypothetical protein [Streptomyces sp. SID5770]